MIGPLCSFKVSKIEIVLFMEISNVFKFLLLIPIKAFSYFKAISASLLSCTSTITESLCLIASAYISSASLVSKAATMIKIFN